MARTRKTLKRGGTLRIGSAVIKVASGAAVVVVKSDEAARYDPPKKQHVMHQHDQEQIKRDDSQ